MYKPFLLQTEKTKTNKSEFLSPKYIYMPITKKITKPVSINEKVLKGEYFNEFNYSSVSGKIVGSKICYNLNKKVNSLVILNNFKEQRVKKIKEDNISKLERLLNNDIMKMLKNSNRVLLITCFQDDFCSFNYERLVSNYYQEIFDTLSYLKDEFNYDDVYIIVKDVQSKEIEKFIRVIGNYPEFKIMTIPSIYPIYKTDYLSNKLGISNYDELNIYEIYKIHGIMKHSYNNTEKYININIDGKNPTVILVKLFTSIKELLSNYHIKYDNYNIYLNGILGGERVNLDNEIIITDDIESITLTKSANKSPLECINCGNCLKHCPKKIDPRLAILDKTYRKNVKNICINCGLCNYICPSYINLKEEIRKDDKDENA